MLKSVQIRHDCVHRNGKIRMESRCLSSRLSIWPISRLTSLTSSPGCPPGLTGTADSLDIKREAKHLVREHREAEVGVEEVAEVLEEEAATPSDSKNAGLRKLNRDEE